MRYCQIKFGSPEYELSLKLREQILRQPLGLVLSREDLRGENQQLHFGLFADQQDVLLACLVVNPLTALKAKLRQMAVAIDSQRQGLGELLVKETEDFLRTHGVQIVELHARTSATGFYEKLGYEPSGPVFTEVGIEHLKMSRRLN